MKRILCETNIVNETTLTSVQAKQTFTVPCDLPSLRATLYVGKYSTSLYASPSLVHDGVTVVVSDTFTLLCSAETVIRGHGQE